MVGGKDAPLQSAEPMKVARAMLAKGFRTKTGRKGIWEWRGDYWVWDGEVWQKRDKEWLEDQSWVGLEDAMVVAGGDGADLKRFSPDLRSVANVVRAATAIMRLPYERVPVNLDGKGRPYEVEGNPADHCVTFKDRVVLVRRSVAEGKVVSVERGDWWFDPVTVPVEWDEGAQCPTWMRCLGEWSKGDEVWERLLQRWFGYCLMGTRKYARWMLLYGKVRGGKGTIAEVMRALVGQAAYAGTTLDDLAGDFGLEGLETARVVAIGEVSSLVGSKGEKASRVVKQMVGADPTAVNAKNKKQNMNVVLGGAPMLSANEIPQLPNKGMGLSSKMLVLPFDVSFLHKEDFDLREKLMKELGGIARWALEGAMALEGEADPEKKWKMPERSLEVVRRYHLQNNQYDSFLEARFVREPGGFVPSYYIWRQWEEWVRSTRSKLHVSKNRLTGVLISESTWDLEPTRLGNGGRRGLKGLRLRKEADDDE